MKELTKDEITSFVYGYGKRTKVTLDFLMENKEVIRAYDSPLGQSILNDLIVVHQELLEKIIEGDVRDEERIRFKVIRDIIFRLSQKFNDYDRKVDEIKVKVSKKGV